MGMKFLSRCLLTTCTICLAIFVLLRYFQSFPFDGTASEVPAAVRSLPNATRGHLSFLTAVWKIRPPRQPPTILLWTPFFSIQDYIPPLETLGCPVPHCNITSNRSNLAHSNAIVFHLRDLQVKDLPSSQTPSQRWVLLYHESPPHTPDVLHDLEGRINWTITYRAESDIILNPPVVKIPTTPPLRNFAKNKTRMVVWFVSNCKTPSNREGYVKELRKSVSVDTFGSCGEKSCLPKMSRDCYDKVAKDYRFYLSFENSLCKDYVTEKFFHVLDTDMVPVVFGGANYAAVAPPNSYINALDFKSPRDLGHFLLSVAQDEERYNSYFAWRRNYAVGLGTGHYACELCKKLHDPREPVKVYQHLHEWWFDDAKCWTWGKP